MTETASPQEGNVEHKLVSVWDAANLLEAQIVKGRLESEGIPALVKGEALGEIYGLTTGPLAETTVLAPEQFAEKAIEILNTPVEWDEEALEEAEEAGNEPTDEKRS
jgi:hypothetical protein